MAKTKTFRVFAKVITYCYQDVEAKNAEQAKDLVQQQMDDEDLDGGEFIIDEKDFSHIISITRLKISETLFLFYRIIKYRLTSFVSFF